MKKVATRARYGGVVKVPAKRLTPNLICVLCGGYLIEATTVQECLHSFCRSCLYTYLDTSTMCPICDAQIRKDGLLVNIRSDETLQRLIYKLIPGLWADEKTRRLKFYSGSPPEDCSFSPSNYGSYPEVLDATTNISVCLRLCDRFPPSMQPKDADAEVNAYTRYLLCPAAFPVRFLKKFIQNKFDMADNLQINVYHDDDEICDTCTLADIAYIYTWRQENPLQLFFTVHKAAPAHTDARLTPNNNLPTSAKSPASGKKTQLTSTTATFKADYSAVSPGANLLPAGEDLRKIIESGLYVSTPSTSRLLPKIAMGNKKDSLDPSGGLKAPPVDSTDIISSNGPTNSSGMLALADKGEASPQKKRMAAPRRKDKHHGFGRRKKKKKRAIALFVGKKVKTSLPPVLLNPTDASTWPKKTVSVTCCVEGERIAPVEVKENSSTGSSDSGKRSLKRKRETSTVAPGNASKRGRASLRSQADSDMANRAFTANATDSSQTISTDVRRSNGGPGGLGVPPSKLMTQPKKMPDVDNAGVSKDDRRGGEEKVGKAAECSTDKMETCVASNIHSENANNCHHPTKESKKEVIKPTKQCNLTLSNNTDAADSKTYLKPDSHTIIEAGDQLLSAATVDETPQLQKIQEQQCYTSITVHAGKHESLATPDPPPAVNSRMNSKHGSVKSKHDPSTDKKTNTSQTRSITGQKGQNKNKDSANLVNPSKTRNEVSMCKGGKVCTPALPTPGKRKGNYGPWGALQNKTPKSTTGSFARRYRCPTRLTKEHESKFHSKADIVGTVKQCADPYSFTTDDIVSLKPTMAYATDTHHHRNALSYLEDYVTVRNGGRGAFAGNADIHRRSRIDALGQNHVIGTVSVSHTLIPLKNIASAAAQRRAEKAASPAACPQTIRELLMTKRSNALSPSSLMSKLRPTPSKRKTPPLNVSQTSEPAVPCIQAPVELTADVPKLKVPPLKLKLSKSGLSPSRDGGSFGPELTKGSPRAGSGKSPKSPKSPKRHHSGHSSGGAQAEIQPDLIPDQITQPRIFLRISKASIPPVQRSIHDSSGVDCGDVVAAGDARPETISTCNGSPQETRQTAEERQENGQQNTENHVLIADPSDGKLSVEVNDEEVSIPSQTVVESKCLPNDLDQSRDMDNLRLLSEASIYMEPIKISASSAEASSAIAEPPVNSVCVQPIKIGTSSVETNSASAEHLVSSTVSDIAGDDSCSTTQRSRKDISRNNNTPGKSKARELSSADKPAVATAGSKDQQQYVMIDLTSDTSESEGVGTGYKSPTNSTETVDSSSDRDVTSSWTILNMPYPTKQEVDIEASPMVPASKGTSGQISVTSGSASHRPTVNPNSTKVVHKSKQNPAQLSSRLSLSHVHKPPQRKALPNNTLSKKSLSCATLVSGQRKPTTIGEIFESKRNMRCSSVPINFATPIPTPNAFSNALRMLVPTSTALSPSFVASVYPMFNSGVILGGNSSCLSNLGLNLCPRVREGLIMLGQAEQSSPQKLTQLPTGNSPTNNKQAVCSNLCPGHSVNGSAVKRDEKRDNN